MYSGKLRKSVAALHEVSDTKWTVLLTVISACFVILKLLFVCGTVTNESDSDNGLRERGTVPAKRQGNQRCSIYSHNDTHAPGRRAVSYTHLTLPAILRV